MLCFSSFAFLFLALAAGTTAAASPNTCQPRSAQPFMPIYHIIGNVTTDADGAVTAVESMGATVQP